MGTKHDLLTEEEMSTFTVNRQVSALLQDMIQAWPDQNRTKINVLDWGCGRGRSVAKLREMGFNAYGVDIDEDTMANGFSLFEQRGLDPNELLVTPTDLRCFSDGFFHVIFSEEVLEHVADLEKNLTEQARLTAPGGVGIHRFPAAKNVWEGHLKMPFVHWLPKGSVRKYWISAMLLLSFGPRPPWVETRGRSFWETCTLYCNYMNEKTFYRDNDAIRETFVKSGFTAEYTLQARPSRLLRFIPTNVRRNGFPRGSITFLVNRETASAQQ